MSPETIVKCLNDEKWKLRLPRQEILLENFVNFRIFLSQTLQVGFQILIRDNPKQTKH